MEVSVIIPTYNRPDDLKEALNSILKQTVLPGEIIIVDDGDVRETARLLEEMGGQIEDKGVCLKHIPKTKTRGINISRNIGIKSSKGDVVLFLDDDVVLEENYVEQILKVYENNPDAVGVQGCIANYVRPRIKNIFNRLFFLVHSEANTNRLLPSIQNVYAMPLDRVINCQWMVGNNMSFRREVFGNLWFDEKLNYGDDSDLSYRVYKRFPHGLYQTPFARLVHKGSNRHRVMDKRSTCRWQVHHLYIFYKNMEQTPKNKAIFLWSRVGLLMAACGVAILGLPEYKSLKFRYLLHAYMLCLKNLSRIKRGDLGFLA